MRQICISFTPGSPPILNVKVTCIATRRHSLLSATRLSYRFLHIPGGAFLKKLLRVPL
jgi:hypothetical protein